ncbi:hypothetical protein [Microbispora sp. NBC_01389]|uniref:hypothetical protein n=1 Tax=Microbispora sp. NBC_01389 TaxID=2903584 RepID=UPI003250BEC4
MIRNTVIAKVVMVLIGIAPLSACSSPGCTLTKEEVKEAQRELISLIPKALAEMSAGAIEKGSECDEDGTGVWADVTVTHVYSYNVVVHELERQGWTVLPPDDPIAAANMSAIMLKKMVNGRTMTVFGDAPDGGPKGSISLTFEFMDDGSQ